MGGGENVPMKNKMTFVLALAAGLLGGLLTRYIAPPIAFAQNQAPVTKEIRAQSFALVDPSDRVVGAFTAEPLYGAPGIFVLPRQGTPNDQGVPQIRRPMRIVLRDSNGREIWSAGGSEVRPLSEMISK
jgi:hypothetical protein